MSKLLSDKLRIFVNSPEGKIDIENYFSKLGRTYIIKKKRYKRFEDWLELNNFDKLMYRLILEHDDDYIDKCQHNGLMPYPNNKLSFVVSYVTRDVVPHPLTVKELECDFPNDIWEFKGYYFQHIHGQGTILRIYNKDDLKMLLQL